MCLYRLWSCEAYPDSEAVHSAESTVFSFKNLKLSVFWAVFSGSRRDGLEDSKDDRQRRHAAGAV